MYTARRARTIHRGADISTTHDSDFYAWAQEQARLLRTGQFEKIDMDKLIEEIEDMGGSKRSELENCLGVLLAQLLKWQFQPERRGRSGVLTAAEQRRRLERLLRKNPSLESELDEAFVDAYGDARLMAARETDLDERVFPDTCPYSIEQALDPDFMPE